ncbi:MAG: hypothetical protein HYW49_06430 [Deltaproteobacteria bacterium]|nr:hypothetical protein [Deltaproteobacteria bacterium]
MRVFAWLLLIAGLAACSASPAKRVPAQEIPRLPAETAAPPSREDFERLAIQIRTQTLITLLTEELRQQGASRDIAPMRYPTDPDELGTELRKIVEREFAGNTAALERADSVDWATLGAWIHAQSGEYYSSIRSTSRLKGNDVGMASFIGVVVGQSLPLVFLAVGQPAIAASIAVVPTGILIALGYASAKALMHRHRVVSYYGSRSNYRYYVNLEAAVRAKLHLRKSSDVLAALTSPDDGDTAVVFSDDAVFMNPWEFLGFTKNRLSYLDLKRIARNRGMPRSEIRAMEKKVDDRSIRSSILFAWIKDHLSAREFSELRRKFSESFVKTGNGTAIGALQDWVVEAPRVASCEGLKAFAAKAPAGVPAPYVAETWYRILVPIFSETVRGVGPVKFRAMVLRSERLDILGRLAVESKDAQEWDEGWNRELNDVVSTACP